MCVCIHYVNLQAHTLTRVLHTRYALLWHVVHVIVHVTATAEPLSPPSFLGSKVVGVGFETKIVTVTTFYVWTFVRGPSSNVD